MASSSFLDLLIAALGGGVSANVIDHLWTEFQERRTSRRTVEHLVETHLDPILKTADELFGKLRDLAIRDFSDVKDGFEDQPPDFEEQVELGATLYLFAHFWARVAILRRDSLYAELGRDKQGERLKAFIQSLESRRVRAIDRAWQRIIGEALFKPGSTDHPRDCMTSYEFLNGYVGDAEFRKWLDPLVEMLGRTSHTGARQRLLLYGAVLHSMIDTLDPKHEITTERPGYGNKLTKKTRRELKYRIFRVYLDLVKEPWKYYSS